MMSGWKFWAISYGLGLIVMSVAIAISLDNKQYDYEAKIWTVALFPIVILIACLRGVREVINNVVFYPCSNLMSFFRGSNEWFCAVTDTEEVRRHGGYRKRKIDQEKTKITNR